MMTASEDRNKEIIAYRSMEYVQRYWHPNADSDITKVNWGLELQNSAVGMASIYFTIDRSLFKLAKNVSPRSGSNAMKAR